MNILLLNSFEAILLVFTPSYLFIYLPLIISLVWLVAYNVYRRRKPGYRGPLSIHDNEYADERFLGI